MKISFLIFIPIVSSLTCYSGSRGEIKQQLMENFVKEKCDESMIYCIESYSDDRNTVTASCQHLSTSKRILDICEKGMEKTGKLTIRCCKTDACNNLGLMKPENSQKSKKE